jgi:hypothetical protein
MNLIANNPYRILGILVDASSKEKLRQIRRLRQYIDAEQEPESDFCSLLTFKIKRTQQSVNDAESKLNLDYDKLSASLFWFYNGYPITDEPAFDALISGDNKLAKTIWQKMTNGGIVTNKNHSAFHNLSTLILSESIFGDKGNLELFKEGIVLKLKFLNSDFVSVFKQSVTDETYNISIKEIQLLFLSLIEDEIKNNQDISSNLLLKIVQGLDFIAKEEFIKKSAESLIEQIEKRIEESKTSRNANQSNANKIWKIVSRKIECKQLDELKLLLGISNMRYINIADKVANEVLQCSIEYFNFHDDKGSELDYFNSAFELATAASTIVCGKIVKDRISDSLTTLNEIKNRDIFDAIIVLKSVKRAFQNNENSFKEELKKVKSKDPFYKFDSALIEVMIKDSIDWKKVNDELRKVLTDKSLVKIKESDLVEEKNEFLELANWIYSTSLENSFIAKVIKKYNSIPPKLPFKIISSEITNTDGKPLYLSVIRFIGLKVKMELFEDCNLTLHLKYLNIKGKTSRGSTSPTGYTLKLEKDVKIGLRTISTTGWGNESECIYEVGSHKIEVYYKDYLIHSKSFEVELAPSEKLKYELKKLELKLVDIKRSNFKKNEIDKLEEEMKIIKSWHFLRSRAEREVQINNQQIKIDEMIKKGESEKDRAIKVQQKMILEIKTKINQSEY